MFRLDGFGIREHKVIDSNDAGDSYRCWRC